MNAASRRDPMFPMSAGEQLRDYLPVATVADILAPARMPSRRHRGRQREFGDPGLDPRSGRALDRRGGLGHHARTRSLSLSYL